MKIDVELTQDEYDLLCMMLGGGMGMIAAHFSTATARKAVVLTNKLLAASPDFRPYDPDSFDPETFPPLRHRKPM